MMYREIELFDIKHYPSAVCSYLCDNANALHNDLYICVEGNRMDIPKDVQESLLSLSKTIQEYFGKNP